ncbi:acetate non-utilizing protein 9 [Mactra antiquata]
MSINHVGQIRALYKALLKLHRGLPFHLQALGDQYVKDEFKRHKECTTKEADIFVNEWTKYYLTLAKQLSARKKEQTIGDNLSPELLENFSDEQVTQLVELFNEATNKSSNQDDKPSR